MNIGIPIGTSLLFNNDNNWIEFKGTITLYLEEDKYD